jgi:hypothetical protein
MPTECPDPPDGLAPELVAEWNAYFDSPLAQATFDVIHLPALARLWRMRQEILDLGAAIDEEPVIRGSRGQPVLHPGTRLRSTLRAEVRLLEGRFGLDPRSRLSLGLDLVPTQKTIEDLAHVPNVERDTRLEVVPYLDDGEQ